MAEELSPSQAARRVGTTTRSIQRWIKLGKLPARRVGGRWRVASDALDAFVVSEPPPHHDPPRGPLAPSGGGPRPIGRLFVANRGEIVHRIRRTAERLGIGVIEPATEGDGALDLLDVDAVVAAAARQGVDAVHPGFGFLAESAVFAEAVEGAGITWVGPPPAAIRAMGDKAAARRLAMELGVPIVPGYDGPDQTDAALAQAASEIGYPLLVKPAAGGGGKGMRVVRDAASLDDSLGAARREARAAFHDERLILERFLEGPRHVEVQVMFDRHGAGVHLGERDCSTQRRHQKVLEETPSPAVSPAIREQLAGAALRLAGVVGYVGAGTCEFLLTDRDEAFFLEMNTRLQVEHPVTELVTGLDLVELQLHVAEGRPLGVEQASVDAMLARGGHAVEVRLYAEDAEDGFLPATGRVERLAWPSGPGIRVDAGIGEGSVVGSRFDPMLAKVIAHGPDRPAALARLTSALDQTLVLGLTTNLRFLRWLVRQPVVLDGQMRIDTLPRIWPPDDWAARTAIPEEAWDAAGHALTGLAVSMRDLTGRETTGRASPDTWLDGWRLNEPQRVRLASEGAERTVALGSRGADGGAGHDHDAVHRAAGHGDAGRGDADGRRRSKVPAPPQVVLAQETAHVDVAGRSVPIRLAAAPDVDRAARAAAGAMLGAGPVDVSAPMPGSILTVHVSAGDSVDAGDRIATLEAMKMEHAVVAPVTGRIAELAARAGDQVSRGDVLAVVEP